MAMHLNLLNIASLVCQLWQAQNAQAITHLGPFFSNSSFTILSLLIVRSSIALMILWIKMHWLQPGAGNIDDA